DVAVTHEPADDVLALRRVQVERHELLVAVVGGEPVAAAVFAGTEAPEVVTPSRHLRLDHLGPELRHEHSTEGTGDHLGQFEHPDAIERKAWRRHSPESSTNARPASAEDPWGSGALDGFTFSGLGLRGIDPAWGPDVNASRHRLSCLAISRCPGVGAGRRRSPSAPPRTLRPRRGHY